MSEFRIDFIRQFAKMYKLITLIIIIILSANVVYANLDVFDAVNILEHLLENKIFNESEILIFDSDCDCKITLNDAFIIMENNILEQKNTCNSSCNKRNMTISSINGTIIEKVIKENEKIKRYKYNGNFSGNFSNVNTNGTASGNITLLMTFSFDNIPFNAIIDINLNGAYNGSYNRTNNNGYTDGNITTHINGTIYANNILFVGNITKTINETNTKELHNQTNIDIYNISVKVLNDNTTNINFLGEENVDNISCYKIVAYLNKNKSIEIIKNFLNSYGSDINLNLNESNIKDAKIIYWIDKENFSIIKEQFDAEIENFTQQINKTIKINKCKDNVCIKDLNIDTINITRGKFSSNIKFYDFALT